MSSIDPYCKDCRWLTSGACDKHYNPSYTFTVDGLLSAANYKRVTITGDSTNFDTFTIPPGIYDMSGVVFPATNTSNYLWLDNVALLEDDFECQEEDYVNLEEGKHYVCSKNNWAEIQRVKVISLPENSVCAIVVLIKDGKESDPVKVDTEDFEWEEVEEIPTKPAYADERAVICEDQYDLLFW